MASDQIYPTKGNLLAIKKSLELAHTGFELMDRKRNILIRETLSLLDDANKIQNTIDTTYKAAYNALQMANITLGVIDEVALSVPIDDGITIKTRSIMGVEIANVDFTPNEVKNYFGYQRSNTMLDEAYQKFDAVKKLTVQLAEIENNVYRLAYGVKKTQKRANALKNIIIPKFESHVKYITEALEEKDREQFTNLKAIKRAKRD